MAAERSPKSKPFFVGKIDFSPTGKMGMDTDLLATALQLARDLNKVPTDFEAIKENARVRALRERDGECTDCNSLMRNWVPKTKSERLLH